MTEPTSEGDDLGHDNSAQLRQEAVRDYERIQELFWQAVEMPAEERVPWIKRKLLPPEIAWRLSAAVIADLGTQ